MSIEEIRDQPFRRPQPPGPISSPTHAGRILIVHDDPIVRDAIQRDFAGNEIMIFADSMTAWGALDRMEPIALLVTGFVFADGTPHGIALAHKARARQPVPRILFVAAAAQDHLREDADGLGNFIEARAGVPAIVEAVRRLLADAGSD